METLDFDYFIWERKPHFENPADYQTEQQDLLLTCHLISDYGRYLKEFCCHVPFTEIMPIIKLNCPNLVQLQLRFVWMNDEDFNDVFRFMPYLETLEVTWSNHKSIPETFIKSLNRVTDTLDGLYYLINGNSYEIHEEQLKYNYFSDSWIPVSKKKIKTIVIRNNIC